VDSRGRAPIEAKIFSSSLPGQTVSATTEKVDSGYAEELASRGVAVWRLPADQNGRVDLAAMLRRIVEEGLLTVLVEGGSGLLGSFFERDLVDRAMVSVAPKIIGGADAPSAVGGLGISIMSEALEFGETDVEMRGVDFWIRAEKPRRPDRGEQTQRGRN
jgi:diaminohydroxyphosphoribosylaminopyrimidine deaminase/5-amino-6-(5-phosphoribosylamino)uracil reductase